MKKLTKLSNLSINPLKVMNGNELKALKGGEQMFICDVWSGSSNIDRFMWSANEEFMAEMECELFYRNGGYSTVCCDCHL